MSSSSQLASLSNITRSFTAILHSKCMSGSTLESTTLSTAFRGNHAVQGPHNQLQVVPQGPRPIGQSYGGFQRNYRQASFCTMPSAPVACMTFTSMSPWYSMAAEVSAHIPGA